MLESNEFASEFASRLQQLLDASRKANREDRELAQAMERMCATEEWRLFVTKLLNSRLQIFSDTLLQPAGGVDGMVRCEFVKGAMFGLTLARDLPSISIESLATLPGGQYDD